MRTNGIGLIFSVMLLAASGAIGHATGESDARMVITALLKGTFERPEAPLAVAPVVVVDDHAIAGWSQDQRGGRALLRKTGGKWSIHLCGGDPLKDADMLASTGIPVAIARELADALAIEESKLPKSTVELFSTFQGVVKMGANGNHPPPGPGAGNHGNHHP